MTQIYGIKNCDTMKKAFKWLDSQGISYVFCDYKKDGADEPVLRDAIKTHGWESVINRRGTTWRKLSDDIKSSMNEDSAVQAAIDNPSLIKRPLLIHNQDIHLGFKDVEYASIFK